MRNLKDKLIDGLKTIMGWIIFLAALIGIPVIIWVFLDPVTFWQRLMTLFIDVVVAVIVLIIAAYYAIDY